MELICRSEDVIAAEAAGDAILLDMSSWTYLNLSITATFLWDLLDEPKTREQMVRAALEHFDDTAGTLATDIDAFLADLIEKRIIVQKTVNDDGLAGATQI